jgi:glycosyltransferase involved in cell wall biosynthesis
VLEALLPYKVLMIAPTSFFSDYGCHVRILAEATHLQDLGHRVIICTYHNGDNLAGLDIRRGWGPPWINRPIVGTSRHKLYLDAMLGLRTLGVALRERPSVIHAHLHEGALIGAIVGRLLHIPVLFDLQGSLTAEMIDHGFLKREGRWYRPLRWLESKIIYMPQVVVTSSYNAARVLREEFSFPENRIVPVPDGANTEVFQPFDDLDGWPERRARLRAMLGVPPDIPVVVYLGLLAPYQGTDILLQAAQLVLREMPEAFFLVMGFPGVDRYAAQAHAQGILERTSFPGRISYLEAPRCLALGDVAVAPKMSATEGSGKICDYMAMALPVVAFDTPVSREMLGDLGIYAQYGDAASLAQGLLQALRDPVGSRALGRRLRERAEVQFSWAQGIQRIVELYGRIGARESLPALRR